jgi:hypothetical protein
MAILDAKLPAWQASTKAVSTTKAEAKVLEGKAPLVVDGGALGSEVRVLLKDQTKTEQNGLYEVTTNEAFAGTGTFAGAGKFATGSNWVLTRTSDADSSGDVTEGMLVPIEDGDTNEDTSWIQRTPGPIEVGVTAQTYEALVAGARGPAGGDLTGTYSKPNVAEAVIDNGNVSPEAAIGYSKLNLASKVAATDLATSAKQLSPQLVTPGESKVASGSTTVEMAAAETTSPYATVSHGLGVKPKSVAAIVALEGGAVGGVFAELNNVGTSTFEVRAARPFGAPGKNTKFTIYWDASS